MKPRDFLEIVNSRRSVRTFSKRAVDKKLIEQIIDAARLAPTARNVQPWEFVIVSDEKVLEQLTGLIENGPFIKDCAVCIVVLCEDTKYYLEDGCAATENILLAIHSLGLGACWVAGDKKPYCEEVKKMLGVAAEYKLVSLIPMGYFEGEVAFHNKRSLKEVLHWERF